jgi:hypothetical protein
MFQIVNDPLKSFDDDVLWQTTKPLEILAYSRPDLMRYE